MNSLQIQNQTVFSWTLTYTLPGVSINLRILKEAGLISEKKEGKNKLYSLNRKTTSELVRFFDDMYDYELKSLKEYAENKKKRK
jgi:ArsR family transcriptional regulator, arsenate/arsenite/antimonite-responsive transcriptional repressor